MIAMILVISLTFSAVCIFTADEAAKKVTLGENRAVLVLGSDSEKLDDGTTDLAGYFEKAKAAIETAASIAPPPISNIYFLIKNLG